MDPQQSTQHGEQQRAWRKQACVADPPKLSLEVEPLEERIAPAFFALDVTRSFTAGGTKGSGGGGLLL